GHIHKVLHPLPFFRTATAQRSPRSGALRLTAQLRCCWTATSQPKERYSLPFRLTHMELRDFQDTMREIYLKRDEQRGVDATFRWLTEELGELARAIRTSERTNLELEFSDVFAWWTSLANILGVDLSAAATRYEDGCPKCGATPCACPM